VIQPGDIVRHASEPVTGPTWTVMAQRGNGEWFLSGPGQQRGLGTAEEDELVVVETAAEVRARKAAKRKAA
jgi:hypothetical protein